MLEKRKFHKYTQLRWFLQDSFFSVQFKLFNHYNIDLNKKTIFDFKGIFKKTYCLIKTYKKIIELNTTNIQNDRMSDLINYFAKKT